MTPGALTILAMDDNIADAERLHGEGRCPWYAVAVVRMSRAAFALQLGEPDAVDRAEWARLSTVEKRARLAQAKINVRLPQPEESRQ